MPEPKIFRRCPTCHVSIRDNAFFCPQCGNKLDPPEVASNKIHDTEEIIPANRTQTDNVTLSDNVTLTDSVTVTDNRTLTEADFRARDEEELGKTPTRRLPSRPGARGEVGSRIQRVTTKARDVEGDVKQRVQKFREISTVVLDEAGYDPSLRFVLVAAVLFILFLLIVLLNKLIS
jgi:hypothetical protein